MRAHSGVYNGRELAHLAGYHLHPVDTGGIREREVQLAGRLPIRFLELGPDVDDTEIAAYVLGSGTLPDGFETP